MKRAKRYTHPEERYANLLERAVECLCEAREALERVDEPGIVPQRAVPGLLTLEAKISAAAEGQRLAARAREKVRSGAQVIDFRAPYSDPTAGSNKRWK